METYNLGGLVDSLGRGGNYKFGMYVEGYRIQSIDNFYVGQYITMHGQELLHGY